MEKGLYLHKSSGSILSHLTGRSTACTSALSLLAFCGVPRDLVFLSYILLLSGSVPSGFSFHLYSSPHRPATWSCGGWLCPTLGISDCLSECLPPRCPLHGTSPIWNWTLHPSCILSLGYSWISTFVLMLLLSDLPGHLNWKLRRYLQFFLILHSHVRMATTYHNIS